MEEIGSCRLTKPSISIMGKIKVLSSDVVAKIAAGEVVERPASVVKELLENALDAGGKEVKVEIQGGGRRLIRVTDDGEGMSPEDARLALERYTTSKIESAEDLFAVRTFGFRGEALSSIAGVSKMKIVTRRKEDPSGFEIQIDGGVVIKSGEAGCPVGTSIEVKDLFYNVPVRLKFLKSPSTELVHISESVSRIALANGETQFQLFHDGRLLAHYPVRQSLTARLAEALGQEAGEKMHPFHHRSGEVEITGYAGQPGYDRPNARGIYLFVNRRPVRDRLLHHAVHEAYRSLLPKERNPVVVLFVNLPAYAVDVNVHPSKGEVKFVDTERVHQGVILGIRRLLEISPWLRKKESPKYEAKEPGSAYSSHSLPEIFPLKGLEASRPPGGKPDHVYAGENPFFRQIRRTYLVFATDEGVTLVDQHAAHERIMVEKLQEQFFQNEIQQQLLMMPETLDLPISQAKSVQEHLGDLEKVGFILEPAGERTFWIRAVPVILAGQEPIQILKEMINEICAWGKGADLSRLFTKLIDLMACHGAIQASQAVNREEAAFLLAQLEKCTSPSRCPHGRPTVIKFTVDDLDKMFARK
jgi:DNA mismatch repair protein MutL